MKKLILSLIIVWFIGCATPQEKFLDSINYQYYKGNCREVAEQKVAVLTAMGYRAEVVNCKARSKYEWNHAAVKVWMPDGAYLLDNGVIMDMPWRYSEVQAQCWMFILP
jgi:hypothetical protein